MLCGALILGMVAVLDTASNLCLADGAPLISNTSAEYRSAYLTAKAWHTRVLTNITWTLPDEATGSEDKILVFWDKIATEVPRSGSSGFESQTSPSTSATASTSSGTNFPEGIGNGSDVCEYETYDTDGTAKTNAFYIAGLYRNATVQLEDSRGTWWYTSTLDQQAVDNRSNTGEALVLLSDPGIYAVCLVLGNDSCAAADCLELAVYQPPYDYMEVDSTNIGALVTVRFNVVTRDAAQGDWGWILGGVDPINFGVDDANSLSSSEVFNTFTEGCWFYFGKAVSLGEPFLCSRDPDTQLASMQSSTANEAYQYGRFQLYSSAVGNVSLWYAMDEDYSFSMVHNFYTCGISVQGPASALTQTTTDVTIVGILEHGPDCHVGNGIPLWVHTAEITFQFVDKKASIFFWGQMDSITPTETRLSVRLPVKGVHEILVKLETGALLTTLNVTAAAAEPYAPASVVNARPPSLIPLHSSCSVSFATRDFYSNDILKGYGNDAFSAWIYQPSSTGEEYTNDSHQSVLDNGDGSYVVQTEPHEETGTVLLFVQRNGDNIPGSPFEIYVYGPGQCVIESLDITVNECEDRLYRSVVHRWKDGVQCEGGLTLPEDARVSCSYIPRTSVVGRVVVVSSVLAAVYAALYLVWIQMHREFVVVKLGQPFVCKLFLMGCILLNLVGPLHLGIPKTALCIARPWLLHIALTFTCGCLYMKTYRVHRLFNNNTLSRISIKDRSLVLWVLRLVSVDFFVLSVWMVVESPSTATVTGVKGYADFQSPVCDPGAEYFNTILFVYKGGLNLFGVVMAAKTWNCADGVGESHSICLSVYNTTLLGFGNIVMHLLLPLNRVALHIGTAFAAVCGTVFTVSVIFGPKVYRLYYYGDIKRGRQDGTNKPHSVPSNYTRNASISTGVHHTVSLSLQGTYGRRDTCEIDADVVAAAAAAAAATAAKVGRSNGLPHNPRHRYAQRVNPVEVLDAGRAGVKQTGPAKGDSAERQKRECGKHLPPIARTQSSIALNPIVTPSRRALPHSINGSIPEDLGSKDILDRETVK